MGMSSLLQLSWSLFTLNQTFTAKRRYGLLALKSFVLLYIFLSVVGAVSWFSVFGSSCLLALVLASTAQFIGVQGVLSAMLAAVATLVYKTLLVWFRAAAGVAESFHIGDYASLSDGFIVSFVVLLDAYSLSYALLTLSIGFWALLFSSNYMRGEPRAVNFLLLLFSFLLGMVLLLVSGNLPTLMLGWELIGCVSFLLINFWTTRVGTAKSAFKAFTFNKLSDVALILSFLVVLLFLPGSFSVDFKNLFLLHGVVVPCFGASVSALSLVLVGFVLCAFCKSAQFGFHVWLPDSMEAPVPASALIHSATLVSAGVFLLGRNEVLTTTPWLSSLLLVWCSFTAFYGGVVAAYQSDLKKILAYSTISHCGFLFLLVVYNNFSALVLYLHLHGWFKSYSFMAGGNIIAKYAGYQDFRRMGGGPLKSTLELIVLVLSLACLGGLPFLLGFFNKHYLLLLEGAAAVHVANVFILLAAFTGLFYTIKTVRSLVCGIARSSEHTTTGLVSGGHRRWYISTEPTSNIILFAVYPICITVLALVVLQRLCWFDGVVYHSAFGLTFFYFYFAVSGAYFRACFTPLGCLLLTKIVYASKLFY